MLNPQKENGYTPIANEIMEAVARLQINATQFRILMVVWRYTYGFSRKEHKLSESFMAQATGIHKKQVGRELSQLIKRNILIEVVPPSFSSTRVIAFNKHYENWQSTKTLTVNKTVDQTGIENVDPPGIENVDQDKQYIKQNLKQGDIGEKGPSKKEINAFYEHIWRIYPRKKGKGGVSDAQKKRLYVIGKEQLERCIKRFKLDMERERRPIDKQLYGSTFFNSGYIDYLDENCNTAEAFEGIPTEHLTQEQRRIRGY